jgi:hypothetical protein
MRNPPDFVVWMLMGRWNREQYFVPWTFWPAGQTGHAPAGEAQFVIGYPTRKAADFGCKRLREIVGKGNCYVQQYGPYS